MKTLKSTFVVFFFVALFSLTFNVRTNAANTSNFQQTINGGTLSIDIVDGTTYVPVGSPSVAFPAATFSFTCQTNTATLGTATQTIYVKNPDASDTGWIASIAASATTALWDSAGVDYDFNDTTGVGCTDGVDTDTVAGRMTIDPSVGTIATGSCLSCNTTSITKGTSTAFAEGTTNSIALLNAASGSSDIGDWKFTGVAISQTIPAEQPAASDYDINMVVSIVAQ